MPFTIDSLALPFSGRSPRARHNSYLAAESQRPLRGVKKIRVLDYITHHGRVTRQGLIEGLQLDAGTACSLLGALLAEKRVVEVDTAVGVYGKLVTVYGPADSPREAQPCAS